MTIAINAPMTVTCPKCASCNATERQHHIMLVSDERGAHYECSVCGLHWALKAIR